MEQDKKKYVIVEEGSLKHDRIEVYKAISANAKTGDAESVRVFAGIDAQEIYNTILDNADDDEYQFAG